MLSFEDFKSLVKHGALVAIDLIVYHQDKVLIGLRKNAPAKGFWFVPGGRIWKNETLPEALGRIALNEIGIEINKTEVTLKGIYEHIYDEKPFIENNFNIHYIVLACLYQAPEHFSDKHLSKVLDQHENYKFISVDELMHDTYVHPFTKNYFSTKPDNLFL